MFSRLDSVSFMGISNSAEILLSEKDLNSMEFNFLIRPTLDFQDECDIIAPLQVTELHQEEEEDKEKLKPAQEHEEEEEEEEEEDQCKLMISSLKIKLPSLEEINIQESSSSSEEEEEEEDGCKTPTSLNHKIPEILPCPPAPRKPKSLPSNKRKPLSAARRGVLLDLSNEIESLFPPSLRADLGAKIKKVRQEINA